MVSLADVERARAVIAPHISRTPLLTSRQGGWHSHPGPVFISVVEGTMTCRTTGPLRGTRPFTRWKS